MDSIAKALNGTIIAVIAVMMATAPAVGQSLALPGSPVERVGMRVSSFWSLLSRAGADAIAPWIAPDFTGVSREGRVARNEEIAALGQMRVAEFAIGGLRVTELGTSTASAEYSLVLRGRIGEVDLSGVYHMTDIWKESAGAWLLWRRAEILAAP